MEKDIKFSQKPRKPSTLFCSCESNVCLMMCYTATGLWQKNGMISWLSNSRSLQNREEMGMQGETTSSTMSKGHAHSEGMSDELAGLLPASWLPDLPLARIYTCGTLTVEVLTRLPSGNEQAVYGPPAALETKGISTALLLLTLLICQPERLASKDFLLQTLARPYKALDEEDDLQEDRAFKRLDNVVYLLRKLLSPPALNHMLGADKLRKHLVRYIRATSESGPSYQLAGRP